MNPRDAINALHPFQGCPFGQLGYFSMASEDTAFFLLIRLEQAPRGYSLCSLLKQTIQLSMHHHCIVPLKIKNGEDGIRTHVALPPNGFQDRLVMTASIPLHLRCVTSQFYICHATINISNILFICKHFLRYFYLPLSATKIRCGKRQNNTIIQISMHR